MKLITRREFELAFFEVVVQLFSHYTTGNKGRPKRGDEDSQDENNSPK